MRIALVVVASLMLIGLAFSALLVLVAVRSARAPRAVPRPSVEGPPRSPVARLHARSTVCLQHGHTYRLAFPMGRLAQQCTACGALAPRLVVRSHRARA